MEELTSMRHELSIDLADDLQAPERTLCTSLSRLEHTGWRSDRRSPGLIPLNFVLLAWALAISFSTLSIWCIGIVIPELKKRHERQGQKGALMASMISVNDIAAMRRCRTR